MGRACRTFFTSYKFSQGSSNGAIALLHNFVILSMRNSYSQQFQIQNVAKNTKKLKVSTGKDFAIKNSN